MFCRTRLFHIRRFPGGTSAPSSNRTCGFPASGSPMISCHRHSQGVEGSLMQVDQPIGSQRLIQRVTVKVPAAPLTPRPDKATKPCLHVPVDLLEGQPRIAKRKIASPAKQEAVDIVNHLLHGSRYPSDGHVMDPGARSFQAFRRGNHIQIPPGSVQTTIKPEGEAKEVKTFPCLSQINHFRFVSIQDQVEAPQRCLYKGVNAWPDRAGHDHPSSSPREPPPQALTEPDMNVSAHPAPIIQPLHARGAGSSGQTNMAVFA